MHRLTAAAIVCAAIAGCTRPVPGPSGEASPNILLVTIDTLRADRVGRGFTPTLDALAARGVRFTQARSVVPLTLPAHVSIMTGLLPPAHGIRLNGAARLDGAATIASRLKSAGYQTRAVVGAFVLDRRFGLDAGFEEYDDAIARDPSATDQLQADRPANEVADRAVAMIDHLAADRPWFVWVHFYDPHAPYAPPDDARTRAGGDAYNGEVAFVDAQLARLVARVSARADAARAATIVLGDHGESLGEHGEPTHGMLVFEAAIRVPLIVAAPGVAPATSGEPASSVDVLPTVMALARQPAEGVAGHDLLAASDAGRESYSETQYPLVAGWTPLRSLVRGSWKLVVSNHPALYDLATDPAEREDLSATRASLVQAMTKRVDTLGATDPGGVKAGAVSAETAERLRSLGYVGSTATPVQATGGIDPASTMEVWASFERALAAMNDRHPATALADLERIAARYPAAPVFQSTYARALAQSGRMEDALVRLRAAVKQWPGDATLYHELAVAAREAGHPEEASRAEAAALALNAEDPAAHNGRGLLLVDAGKAVEAATAFTDAVRLDPTNAVYHANLGNARRALGDLVSAEAAYRRALELAPRLPDAANGLGVVLVQRHQVAEAVRWLEIAAADPAFIEAQLNLGIALQEAGDVTRARAQYQRVIGTAPPRAREREAARTLLAQLGRR